MWTWGGHLAGGKLLQEGGGPYEGEWKNGHLPPPPFDGKDCKIFLPKKRPKSRPLTPEAPVQPPPPLPGTGGPPWGNFPPAPSGCAHRFGFCGPHRLHLFAQKRRGNVLWE